MAYYSQIAVIAACLPRGPVIWSYFRQQTLSKHLEVGPASGPAHSLCGALGLGVPGGPAPVVLLRALGLWLPPSSAGLPSAVCLVQEVGLEAASQLPGRLVCQAPSSCPQMGREPCAFESYQGPSWASWASAGWGPRERPKPAGVTGQEQEGSLLVSALSAETSSLTTFCWTSKVSRGRRPASGRAPALGTHPWSSGQPSVLSPCRTRALDRLQHRHHHKGRGEGDRASWDQTLHG